MCDSLSTKGCSCVVLFSGVSRYVGEGVREGGREGMNNNCTFMAQEFIKVCVGE